MSESVQLIPAQLAAPAKRAQSTALSPTSSLSRLAKPLHVLDTGMGETVFCYIKVGARKGSVSLRNLPPEVARSVAMLVVNHGKQRVRIQWYPHADSPEIVEDLPFSALPQIVDDLIAAGFGLQPPPPVRPEPPPVVPVTSPLRLGP